MRIVFVIVLLGLGLAFGHVAQVYAATPTPTPSPTPTSTPTPTPFLTPDVNVAWGLPAVTDEAGATIVPAQGVSLSYSVNAGEIAIVLLVVLIVVSVWAMFVIWYVRLRG